jgi:hypothetical protein
MIDRDLNAALNLEQLTTGSSPERYACGEMISPGYQAVLVEAGTEQQSTNVFVQVSENGYLGVLQSTGPASFYRDCRAAFAALHSS